MAPISKKHNRSRFLTWLRLGDLSLVILGVAVCAYVAMTAGQVIGGYSLTESVPDKIVRLQVVDGSGQPGLLTAVLKRLNNISDDELAITIVDTVPFDLRPLARSVVISRESDCEAVRDLADRLGFDPDHVIDRPLTNNTRLVAATIVLGRDAQLYHLVDLSGMED